MSAVPALMNTEMKLSLTSENLVHQFGFDLQNNAVLEWAELRQWLDGISWMRLVKRVDHESFDTLEFCGFYRFKKDASSGVVTLQRKTFVINDQNQPVWSWIKTDFAPKFTLQSCKSSWFNAFEELLTHTVDAIFLDLVKQGIKTVVVEQNSKRKKTQGKVVSFEAFDEREQRIHFIHIGESWGRELLVRRMTNQLSILLGSSKPASRYLYKHLWDFVDRRYLSLFMKISQKALSEVYFGDVHRLSKTKLDLEYMQNNALWLPWLTALDWKSKGVLVEPNLFSYEYLLPKLRCKVSRKSIRKVNRQPRKVQFWLIECLDDLPTNLQLLDALRGYPSSVVLTLVKEARNLAEYLYCNGEGVKLNDEVLLRVVQCWARYFAPMTTHVKVRKHRDQCLRALAQFEDIWGWVLMQDYRVQKNQSWYSLVQRHDQWVEEINKRDAAQLEEQYSRVWGAASLTYEELIREDVQIEEITQGERLHREGKEMEHCVWSYLNDCLKQRYRVFSLRTPEERVTLGLYMDPVTLKCTYDQLRGLDNDIASWSMHQLAKRLIKQINSEG